MGVIGGPRYGGGFYLTIFLTAGGQSPFAFAKVEAEIDLRASTVAVTSTTNVTQGTGAILEQEPLYIRGEIFSVNPSLFQQAIETGNKELIIAGTITKTITQEFTGSATVPIVTRVSVVLLKRKTSDNSFISQTFEDLVIDHRDADATLGRVYTQSVSLSI